jgi:hypothetical protein
VSEPAADAVTLEEAQRWCREYEATLRLLFRGEMPKEIVAELDALPDGPGVRHALRRWSVLKHHYIARYTAASAAAESTATDEERTTTVRQIIRREPVRVEVCGGERVVDVTGRSWSALYEIAAHSLTARDLERAMRDEADPGLFRRMAFELMLHRRSIWAHALTPTGAPATSLGECPSWWTELGPDDDAVLLAGLWEVMHGRYLRLGDAPAQKDAGGGYREDVGWHSLLTSLAVHDRVDPAAYYDRDLYQTIVSRRVSSPPPVEA